MKNTCLILIISILFLSCSKDVMDRIIFIPDEIDSNLPAYTEWGYNTFGAEFEGDYFLVSNDIVPCKILYDSGKLQFSLHGRVGYNNKMDMLFTFPAQEMKKYLDLVQLNDVEIDLASADCVVKIIKKGEIDFTVNVLEGKLHFKRAQTLSIDNEVNRVILSGVFNVQFLEKGYPTYISDGRFDMGIDEKVFWAF